MTTDEIARNKKIVDAFIQELFTAGDPTAVDRYLDPAFVDHDPTVPGTSGPDTMRQAEAMIRAALPDWRSELDDLVGEGDIVVERFTASGTHTGPLWGVEPTGKQLVLRGINIFRLVDGVIVERWGRVDEAGLLRQLGLVPG
jgi:predicted ester cyclase